ncbi:MAG: cell wall hydrolase/autolysin [Thermoleophilia bacterium]|nr:cell wall hydrolase/autolysin [Thermoleophilia bacterium]
MFASLTATVAASLVAVTGGPSADAQGTARAGADAAVRAPLAGLVVNVDPGHNPGNATYATAINRIVQRGPIRKACDTTGTTTNGGYPEWLFTQQLATRLARRLRAAGATVTFTRANGAPAWGPCITQRADIGNRANVSISLHTDGAPTRARGFHVIRPGFVPGYTGDILRRSSTLAVQVRDGLRRVPGGVPVSNYAGRAGIDVRNDLGGLTLSNVPKVMVEHGNMRNATDAGILASSLQQERTAAALTAALIRWRAAELAAG